MDYKLSTNENGDVKAIMKAGSSYVLTTMPAGKATGIIESAKQVEKSVTRAGFEICVNDGEYYFAGNIGKATAKAEKATDEPVKAEKKPVKKTTAKKKAE
jgi:hypothetical protein